MIGLTPNRSIIESPIPDDVVAIEFGAFFSLNAAVILFFAPTQSGINLPRLSLLRQPQSATGILPQPAGKLPD